MIRIATPNDAPAIARLFHESVKKVNCRDYTEAQINAWAGAAPDDEKWRLRQATRMTFVHEENGVIRGFAELEKDGHIGALYVHAEHQRQGTASALLQRLEEQAVACGAGSLRTEASITAQPFFAKHGFETVVAQQVEYRGQKFRNYRMRKKL